MATLYLLLSICELYCIKGSISVGDILNYIVDEYLPVLSPTVDTLELVVTLETLV